MPRPILDEKHIHPAIAQHLAELHHEMLARIQTTISQHPVVVIGMAGNPFVGKARKLLLAKGLAHEYLEFGSYLSGWRQRTAIKMWSGWPTFPMVFVRGVLVGGADDLRNYMHAEGEF